jgi:hypothetical protein
VPGLIAAIAYVLYAPVVVMEDISARAALRRARHLARRSWSTVLIITLLQFALPVLVWVTAVDSSFTFSSMSTGSQRSGLQHRGLVVVGDVSAPRRLRRAADGDDDSVAVPEVATGWR